MTSEFDPSEQPMQSKTSASSSNGGRPPDELDSLIDRLSDEALTALGAAEGMRVAAEIGHIHMEHLLSGLFRQDPGPARLAVRAAGISDQGFARILKAASDNGTPVPETSAVAALSPMPPVSNHVRQALQNALGSPDDPGRDARIDTKHLFAAAMSVSSCSLIKELDARGVSGTTALSWDDPSFASTLRSDDRATSKAMAKADQPADKDLIGHQKIVDSLCELLVGDSTTFPLAIAISAPWGGGKSSIMRMVRKRLENPPAPPVEPFRVRLGRAIRLRLGLERPEPRWVTVEFPAWRYETGEQLWAAMAKTTYDQALRQRENWLGRFLFRLGLERRRGTAGRAMKRGATILLAGLAGAGLTFIAALIASQTGVTEPGQAPGTAGVAGGTVAAVGGVVALLQAFWGGISDPFKRAVESFADQPRVEGGDGFTLAAAGQIDALMAQLLSGHGRVAIFIDDLDRCTPRNLVRVIEAINQIFVAGSIIAERPDPGNRLRQLIRRLLRQPKPKPEDRRLAFIMGMDRYVVARGIEAEYEQLMARLDQKKDPAARDYGLAFLDKIVQLWITIPAPTLPEMTALLSNVAGISASAGGATEEEIETIKQNLERTVSSLKLDDRETRAAIVRRANAQSEPGHEFATQLAGERFLAQHAAPAARDSEEVWAAMIAGLEVLEPNPRQVKRFNNAFRLQLNVAARSDKITFTPEQLAALARWVAIRMRWGTLARDLDDETFLLRALEVTAQSAVPKAPNDHSIVEQQKARNTAWFDEKEFPDLPALHDAIRPDSGRARISDLPFKDFVPIS